LGVWDFQKRMSVLKVSKHGAEKLGRIADVLARGEFLTAHAASAMYRVHDLEKK
ncbi:histidinol dehydrogenase, partial [Parasutterella excrementihominis]